MIKIPKNAVGYPMKQPIQNSIFLILNVWPSNFSQNGWWLQRNCLSLSGFEKIFFLLLFLSE